MRILLTASLSFFLYGCASLPQMFQSVENIADNDAMELTFSKDAMKKDIQVNVTMQGAAK